jgi:hypothetical protein
MSSALEPVLRKLEELGKVLVVAGTSGASVNMTGELQFTVRPASILLELKGCACRVHIDPNSFQTLHFTEEDLGRGEPDPVVQFADASDRPVLRIFCPFEKEKFLAVRDSLQHGG